MPRGSLPGARVILLGTGTADEPDDAALVEALCRRAPGAELLAWRRFGPLVARTVRRLGGTEELEIDLRRGSVNVRGPLAGPGITLHAGQHLVAFVREGTLRVETADAAGAAVIADAADREPPPAGSPSAAPGAGGAPAAPPAAISRSRASREKPPAIARPDMATDPATWSRRVAAGDFRGVLDEAGLKGIDACIASCPVESLVALTDAARYGGHRELARRLLLATRDRFPGSPPARAAAFLLGRMAERADAIEWYDRYLGESPDGVYAAEALGRKMLAIDRLGDRARARRIAVEYRNRFPTGAYLPQATALLQHP